MSVFRLLFEADRWVRAYKWDSHGAQRALGVLPICQEQVSTLFQRQEGLGHWLARRKRLQQTFFRGLHVHRDDVGPGKNVDIVCLAHEYKAPDESFDVEKMRAFFIFRISKFRQSFHSWNYAGNSFSHGEMANIKTRPHYLHSVCHAL